MTTIASDDFTDSDSTELSAHTPSGGGSWTRLTGASGSDTIVINSNRAKANAAGGSGWAWYYHSASPASAAYDVSYTIRYSPAGGVPTIGLVARSSTSAATGYLYWPSSRHELFKVSSGSFTSLGSWSTSPASGDVIKLEIKDATKKIFVNGTERFSSTDNTITSAGKAGLRCFSTGASHGIIDDFLVEEVGGGSYSLTAEGASYTYTGGTATLRAARKLSASGITYTYTGGTASLRSARKLLASGGTFTYTGGTATLRADRQLVAVGATYTYTGGTASLRVARKLAAAGITYTYTGGTADLIYTPISGSTYTLVCTGGTFTYSGGDATLRAARKLSAVGGTYTYTGGDALLRAGRKLLAAGGTFTYSGGAISLRAARKLIAAGGSYTYTGGTVTFRYSGAASSGGTVGLTWVA